MCTLKTMQAIQLQYYMFDDNIAYNITASTIDISHWSCINQKKSACQLAS